MQQLKILIVTLLVGLNFSASCIADGPGQEPLNDGPYIFKVKDGFKVKWIENGILRKENLKSENFAEIKKKFNLLFDYNDLSAAYLEKEEYKQVYSGVDSIGVISDIHGEYDFYIDLLKGMGVIDKNLNWSFGKGHLVVLGDIFDRGDKVTEAMWHLFGLEKQAKKAGGMVHVLLGNHEFLALGNDSRYSNKKYFKVADLTLTSYSDLYSGESVLGRWLRSKPVIVSINDNLFVHGGVSIYMVRRNLDAEKTNRIFSENILCKESSLINENEELKFLDNENGPIWYRGYFQDTKFCEVKMDSILNFYGKKHIVVGHTECDVINTLFGSKVLGIDTGTMNEVPSEMLIIKEGKYYRGLVSGERFLLETGEPSSSSTTR